MPVDLAAVYEAYFSKIYNFIFYRVMHKEIAEDLVSTTFLKVAEKFHTFDPKKGSVAAWIFAIAQNTLNDYFRSRYVTASLDEVMDSLTGSVDFEEQSRLIQDETRQELYRALSKLDDRTREIISQKYFLDRTIREIALDIDMNESTVSTIHNRGLEKLRKHMGDFEL